MKNAVIERAYTLLNTPIDPQLITPLELSGGAVNYFEADAGEIVEYFSSPSADRSIAGIYSIDANGSIIYHKIGLKTPIAISFSGLQTKLETVLLDDILNSRDQTALADTKNSLILQLDAKETQLVCNLCLNVASQEINRATGEDLLDVIIKMQQKISDYSTDYVLLVAPNVMSGIETYDKDQVTNFNYKMSILEEIAKLGIKKIVKVVGNSLYNDVETSILASGKAILIGRNSKLVRQSPITLARKKFSKEIAEFSGAGEGAVRLVNVIETPYVVNSDSANTLGYGVFAYESLAVVLLNYRAVSWSSDIIS